MQDFIAKFKKANGNATPDALAGLGYDAANILFDALKKTKGAGGKELRDAIAATRDFKGVTGGITIDENRNAKKALVIVQMKKSAAGEIGPSLVARVEPVAK
jgi:branched-chain amino acid transport system substrate-binding protein